MANAKTTALPSAAKMTVTLETYQNGSSALVDLIGHLQCLMDNDQRVTIGVSQYGDGTVWLDFTPNVPHAVVHQVVDYYIERDEDGYEHLVSKLSLMALSSILSILHTVELMKQPMEKTLGEVLREKM